MGRKIASAMILAAMAVVPTGCGTSGPQPLNAEAFLAKPPVVNDHPSTAPVEAKHGDDPEIVAPQKAVMNPPLAVPPAVRPIDPTEPAPASEVVQASTVIPATQPATAPVLPGGTYMTLGGIVAEVNGTPIYAHTILALLDKEFAARAKEMDIDRFREFARSELDRQRHVLISDEIEFVAARRELSDEDQKIVQLITEQYQRQKVTEAGGSIELARRKALADGTTFEEMMRKQNRQTMQTLFWQRRIIPRIQVTPESMRDFYRDNVAQHYSEPDRAQFRVIKIDPKRLGGADPRAAALEKIKYVLGKATRGDDFAALAKAENQDDYLKSNSGDAGGWITRNSYLIEPVEKAVWQLQPGQITGIIEANDAFYIAKLEEKKLGRIRPFDDQTVQEDIHDRLFKAQFADLREKVQHDLVNTDDTIIANDSQLTTVLDMAMQKYPRWAKR